MIRKFPRVLAPCLKAGTIMVSLLSGYYHRAIAGVCGGPPGTYNCTGADRPGIDPTISLTSSPAGSLTVTTAPGFGIDTRTTAGSISAFDLTSAGNLLFNDVNSSKIFGLYYGIFARNTGGGSLSITTSGSVRGEYGVGILALNLGTDLSISAADVSGYYAGIYAANVGSGSLSITSSGTVTSVYGVGIYAYNRGTDLSISAADVSGYYSGIYAVNVGSGSLSVTTSGTVTATSSTFIPGYGDGIFAYNRGTDLSISAANVSGYASGIYAINRGSGSLSVTTSGTVTAVGFGIAAINLGGQPTTINVGPLSVVEGGFTGIYAYSSGGQSITINSSGQVRNLTRSPADPAIVTRGGPTTVNLNPGSVTTGVIDLGAFNDMVTLGGTLHGSILLNDGNDTFIQVGGSWLNGTADGGAGSDTLGFNNMGTVHGSLLGTTYLNFENLGIYGGSNTLTGTWDFSGGSTTVHAGSLTVNGTLLTGNGMTVRPGAFLGGIGMINGDVVNYGTISPGNSIGTMHINGSLSFMPGSAYMVELAQGGRSDLIQVSGPVSISGSTLRAYLRRALYPDGYNWTIIKAGGGISGKFSSIRTNFTSHTIALRQSIQGGSLELYVDRTPYTSFGATPNQSAVGMGLDALLSSARGTMAELLMAMDFDMNPSQIRATLAGLNPDMYTAFPASGLETATIFGQTVNQHQQESRLAAAFPAEDRKPHLWNAWFRALGSRLDRNGGDDITGYDLTTGGAVFGADRGFGSASRAGLMLGYSDGDLDWGESGHSGKITGKFLGLYGSTGYEDFYLDLAAGYTDLDNSAKRLITLPIGTISRSASSDANVWSGSLTAGYDFKPASLRVGPVASIGYLSLEQDGFGENDNTDFSVSLDNSEAESLVSRLGLRLGGLFEGGGWRFLPRGELSWLHQFKDDPVELTASFAGYPAASFNVSGAAPAGDQALFSLGLSAEYGTNLTLYTDYSMTASDEQRLQLLSFGLAWLF